MYRTCLYWGLLASLLFFSRAAQAATLLSAQLVIDGSLDPPGDRVRVIVVLDPGEQAVDVEVRAFVVQQGPTRSIMPIRASGGTDPPDGAPQLVLKGRAQATRPDEAISVDIAVPFASLGLAEGLHELGYEVRLVSADRCLASTALPLTFVQVSSEPRTELRPRLAGDMAQAGPVPREPHEAEVYIVEDGILRRETVTLPPPAPAPSDLPSEPVAVRIPGGYQRVLAKRILEPGTRDIPEDIAVEQELAPMREGAWASLAEFEPQSKRTVFFVTNRAVAKPAETGYEKFGNTATDEVLYGTCLINIPIEVHRKGLLEVPNAWWPVEDPRKHFLLEKLELITRDVFREGLAEDDVLLFIHGYNTRFDFAVLRAAQLTHDLEFPGKSVAFVWPSAASTRRYAHDEEQAARSVDPLAALLSQLAHSPDDQPRKLHVIVHSMGNRIFLAAVRQWELQLGQEAGVNKRIGRVVLAAPDVDAATFAALVPSVIRMSERTTLYYCEQDRALEVSRLVHLNKPVGLGPFFMEGLDTINADNANTSFLGHGYFAEGNLLLLDLRLLTLFQLAPEQRRPPLAQRTLMFGFPHWSFRAPP